MAVAHDVRRRWEGAVQRAQKTLRTPAGIRSVVFVIKIAAHGPSTTTHAP
ncbi:MAG: hypothetical protein AAFQ35_12940 [Pseudomonadota bacterium]